MKNLLPAGAISLMVLAFSSITPAEARFLQTDPVGYGDDLDAYTYVGNDPTDKTDPTGETCAQGKDGQYSCVIDRIIDSKGNALARNTLSPTLQKQIARFEKSYTSAVNRLASHPGRNHTINLNDPNGRNRSATVNSGELARALAGRFFVASPFAVGGGSTMGNTTTVDSSGISGVGTARGVPTGNTELLREATVAHEGMHGFGTYTDDYIAPGGTAQMGDSYYQSAHQQPYNAAAVDLLH